AVAVASNDFHRRGVIGWPQRENPGEANGSRHGEMPPDRTGHPHRFDYGSQELRGHAGIFRAGPLPDLSDRARMVCQGGLGLRRRAAPAARATQGGPLSLLPAAAGDRRAASAYLEWLNNTVATRRPMITRPAPSWRR